MSDGELLLAVPADGVKGKTWGPSTCHQRERGQIPLRPPLAPRPGGVWSKSAPNLDKPRNALTRPQHDIGNDIPPSTTSTTTTTTSTATIYNNNLISSSKTNSNNNHNNNRTTPPNSHHHNKHYLLNNKQNNSSTPSLTNSSSSTTTLSTLQLFKSKVSAIGYNAFGLTDSFKPFRICGAGPPHRNNSFPTHEGALTPRETLAAAAAAARQKRLSRSIGNISESHYDTVFTTNSFVIARGRGGGAGNNSTNSSLIALNTAATDSNHSEPLLIHDDDRQQLLNDFN